MPGDGRGVLRDEASTGSASPQDERGGGGERGLRFERGVTGSVLLLDEWGNGSAGQGLPFGGGAAGSVLPLYERGHLRGEQRLRFGADAAGSDHLPDERGIGAGELGVRFGGYAVWWDRVDRAGDVMRAGVFAAASGVPLLWQHRGRAIGWATVAEDDLGLRVAGRIVAAEPARLVRSGALAGLSVGYRPRRTRQGAWREILLADLVEVSLVAVPMQARARIDLIDR